MKVNKIEFESFRNIDSEIIEFSDGINVIYGENAQGKTNILEGIYLFARGKSFRAFKDKELIKFDKNIAYAKMEFQVKDDKTTLGVEIPKNQVKKFGFEPEEALVVTIDGEGKIFCQQKEEKNV